MKHVNTTCKGKAKAKIRPMVCMVSSLLRSRYRVVTQSSSGALRDEPNNGCEGDYMVREFRLQESGKFLHVVFGIREIFARAIRNPTNN